MTIRTLLITTAATAAVGLAAAAPAHASGTHWCARASGPSIAASPSTSCGFAREIAYSWYFRDPTTAFTARGRVRSPVTGRFYAVSCRFDGYEWVTCRGPAWTGVRVYFVDDSR